MLLDENGEPRIFTHLCATTEEGKPMPFAVLQKFAIEILVNLFTEGEKPMEVLHLNEKFSEDLPNLVLKSVNGKVYYVAISAFMFPKNNTLIDDVKITKMNEIAFKNNAQAAIAEMGFYCFSSENPSQAIYGGNYSVKYDGLRILEPPKPRFLFDIIKNIFG
jgi:hypothetical protein